MSKTSKPAKAKEKKPRHDGSPTKRRGGRPDKGTEPLRDLQAVAEFLRLVDGNLGLTARKFGVSRATLAQCVARHEWLQEIVRDARDSSVDHSETGLRKAILSGDRWAIQYTLSTLGKDRGYVKREETDVRGSVDQVLKVLVVDPETGMTIQDMV